MPEKTRPFLTLYVAWHPSFAVGAQLATDIHSHFRRASLENVSGGIGLSVLNVPHPSGASSLPGYIDFDGAETTAVIALVDREWAEDAAWVSWYGEVSSQAADRGLSTRVFPVFLDETATQIGITEQALRWDRWSDLAPNDRLQRLILGLSHEFCRMLRLYLTQLEHPEERCENRLRAYLEPVMVFLSHSKHDEYGERVARAIRRRIHEGTENLDSFFDMHDIAAGVHFGDVILERLRTSAVVAIHSDSYSTREWCCREVIEAKRASVPLVVAHCVTDREERGFPYLGNVPSVRLDPATDERIELVVARLLDEVLKDFVWRCRIKSTKAAASEDTVFLPRVPELISLAASDLSDRRDATLVYPEPPLSAEEASLFRSIAPHLKLRSLNQWIAESAA